MGHSDRNIFPIGSLNSGIIVIRSGQNVDKCTEMIPQGPIVTMIPESYIENNCDIFNSVSKTSDLAYRGYPWHGTMKNETINLVENLRENTIFKNAECKENFNVEKVGRKNSVIFDRTNSVLN